MYAEHTPELCLVCGAVELGRREFIRYAGAFAGVAAVSPQVVTSCWSRGQTNILVITADDMRYDHLPYMPKTLAAFADGTNFTACRTNVSLCQPARIGVLTGQFARRNGVYTNSSYMTDPTNSLGPWLQGGGYTTAMIGKYPAPFGGTRLQGWDVQRTFTPATEQSAYGFTVFDGTSSSSPDGYQTEYVTAQVQEFITGAKKPWFCWATPTNPHVNSDDFKLVPRPQDLSTWLDVVWPLVDDDLHGKPSWMQALTPLSDTAKYSIRLAAIGQLQELNSVDDGVDAIFGTLRDTGQLDHTIVMFTSDNGVLYGEHDIYHLAPSEKNVPYDPSMHVPLLARGPGFAVGTSTMPVCLQDMTATCLAVSGAHAGLVVDGLDIRSGSISIPNRVLLHERTDAINPVPGMPSGAGVTTSTRKLWRHDAEDPDRFEMYCLDTDPDELENVAYDPSYLDERNALEAKLDALLGA